MQQFWEDFQMALGTVRGNKMRAFLTVLGVMIGVITVMLMVAFVVGIQTQVEHSVESWGTHTIFVHKFNPGVRLTRLTSEERQRPPLTYDDALAIDDQCEAVRVAVPLLRLPPRTFTVVRYGDQELYLVDVQGTLPTYERVSNVAIRQGRFFSESENQHRQEVCIIGSFIADKLFPDVDPLGKELQINNKGFTIVGVMERQDTMLSGGGEGSGGLNKTIYVPYQTLAKMDPEQEESFILAEAQTGQVDRAIDEITELLRRRRGVPADKPNNFGISTPESIQQDVNELVFGVFILMIAIASVALVVGGIGVMNIMLVSVTERTREIGIRKAIGARRSNITWQFLTEAIVLTGIGGIIGIILGWGLSLLLKTLMPTYVPLWAPVAGLAVSVGVGLFFGLWPAMKAARLDPVEALRYE
jgi:putative ABC transport system permease protein